MTKIMKKEIIKFVQNDAIKQTRSNKEACKCLEWLMANESAIISERSLIDPNLEFGAQINSCSILSFKKKTSTRNFE